MAINTQTPTTTAHTTIPDSLPGSLPDSYPKLPDTRPLTGINRHNYPINPEKLREDDFEDDSASESGSKKDSSSIIEGLPLPRWAKSYLKKWLTYSGRSKNGEQQELPMPSAADAMKIISNFQQERRIALLSAAQMQEMAETGHCTLINGNIIPVPPEVRAAARKFMAKNAALFKALESPVTGNRDGVFRREDYLDILKNGSMYKRAPSYPKYYGLYYKDFYKHVMEGLLSTNHPEEYAAAKTMNRFQIRNRIKLLNIKQIKQMAESGYCTLPKGRTIRISPKTWRASLEFVEDDCSLYKKLESVVSGEYDESLSTEGYDEAVDNRLLSDAHASQHIAHSHPSNSYWAQPAGAT